jgi:predicted lipoprotein with Yx(FWY)xxD motif
VRPRATKAAVLAAAGALGVAACGTSAEPKGPPAGAPSIPARASDPPPRPAVKALVAVRVARTAYGPALVDRRGFALYRFTHDRSSASTCYGACAVAWPPYLVKQRTAGADRGAHASSLGTTRRQDGRLQLTYAGHPLYYYVGDRRPHEVLCQAVTEYGGTWNVVAPDGHAIH